MYLLYILFSPRGLFSCIIYRIVEFLVHFFDNLQWVFYFMGKRKEKQKKQKNKKRGEREHASFIFF